MGAGVEWVIIRILQFPCTALLDRIVAYLLRLCLGLYDDAAGSMLAHPLDIMAINWPYQVRAATQTIKRPK